jgi:hypothetical protein
VALTAANGLPIVKAKIEDATGKPLTASDLTVLSALLDGVAQWIEEDAVVSATGIDPQGGSVSSTGTIA